MKISHKVLIGFVVAIVAIGIVLKTAGAIFWFAFQWLALPLLGVGGFVLLCWLVWPDGTKRVLSRIGQGVVGWYRKRHVE